MAIGTPVAGNAAYSASGGTSVSPTYPTGIQSTDALVLFVGQKPSTANGGTVTTPSGWTLRDELTAAGGYGTTLGADTGNTNLRVYTKDTVTGSETGTLAVTIGTNNVSWAVVIRVPSGGNGLLYGSSDGSKTAAGASVSVTLAANPGLQTGDVALWGMCIPTDVTTPSQFSAHSISASGATFDTPVELQEPDSATGNDIGGFLAYASVTAGSSSAAPTITATAAGTTTNVRGPLVLLRVREAAATITGSGDLVSDSSSAAGSGAREVPGAGSLASDAATASGTGSIGGATISGSGALSAQAAVVAGTAEREIIEIGSAQAFAAQSAVVVGTATVTPSTVTITGSGGLSSQSATASGTAERTITSAGAITPQSAIVAGSATRVITGFGAALGATASVSGSGKRTVTSAGSGAVSAQASTASGSGTVVPATGTVTGSGALSSQAAIVSGFAERTLKASGSLASQASTTSGAGAVTGQLAGSGGLVAQAATAAGVGERILTGSGAGASQALSLIHI